MSASILIIDDDPSLVHMIATDLEEEGYLITIGYDGQAAIQLAKADLPHLIIMDVNMPMTNGIKAMESLRQNPDTRNIPIILLTGESSDTVFPKIHSMDRVAHIKKPIDLEDLNSLVKQFIKQYPTR